MKLTCEFRGLRSYFRCYVIKKQILEDGDLSSNQLLINYLESPSDTLALLRLAFCSSLVAVSYIGCGCPIQYKQAFYSVKRYSTIYCVTTKYQIFSFHIVYLWFLCFCHYSRVALCQLYHKRHGLLTQVCSCPQNVLRLRRISLCPSGHTFFISYL